MRRIIQSILLTAAALFLVGCTTRQEQAQPEDENNQAEKVVNYSELSIDELEVLGYDGDVEAQYRLGQLYEYGSEDIDQDFDLAREWYERAAKQGSPDAWTALGYFYLNGCGVETSLDQAASDFQQAISLGSTEANAGFARTYLSGYGDPAQQAQMAFSYASISEEAGDLDGICLMGYLCEQGIGCEQNYEQAMEYYQRVLETEEPELTDEYAWNEAATRLGTMYVEGKGVETDERQALSYFEMAADRGYRMAQYLVGVMYENGYGMDADYGEAMRWYQLAADQGYAPALNQIGYLYFNGYGVDVDYEETAYYQKLSAMYGYGPAQLNLGYLYEYGYGVEQDYSVAMAYYQMAADQGMEGAQEALSRVSVEMQEAAQAG